MADVQSSSDAELVRRFQQGDEQAFAMLVERFQDRIYRLALVWLRDSQNAGDACQEVFLRAYKGLGRFRFRSAPFTWLYRATRNVCSELNRQRTAEALKAEPMDLSGGAEEELRSEQVAQQVRRMVEQLPERQQQVVLLRVFEDLSVAETAHAMGCRPGTVKALLHKAMTRLRSEANRTSSEELSA